MARTQQDYDDIPGTFVFDAERSREGFGINMFCMSLMKDANRKAFKADEAEYLKNPTVESIRSTYDKLELIPDQDFRYRAMDKDDWKWSLHAALSLPHSLSLFLQVANDHLRLQDKYARPEFIPATSTRSDWYWLTRLQCAL